VIVQKVFTQEDEREMTISGRENTSYRVGTYCELMMVVAMLRVVLLGMMLLGVVIVMVKVMMVQMMMISRVILIVGIVILRMLEKSEVIGVVVEWLMVAAVMVVDIGRK